jgi:hypothetical protein
MEKIAGIPKDKFYFELPPKPDWFEEELKSIGNINGKPLFRVVDGQREQVFRCGKFRVKHLLTNNGFPCFIPVVDTYYFKKYKNSNEIKRYPSREEAIKDKNEELEDEVEFTSNVEVRQIGRPCWVIETYISPTEINEEVWNNNRFQFLKKNGIDQLIDVLGEFPRDGMYVYCFSIVDENGNARSPGQADIEECRKRLQLSQLDKKSLEQRIKEFHQREREFEEKQIQRISDNVVQFFGLSYKKFFNAEISKPIGKIYEGSSSSRD